MKSKQWIFLIIILGACLIGLSFLNLGDSFVYFYTPKETIEKASELSGKKIRVGAMVKTGTIKWNAESLALKFIATDLNGSEIPVFHKGIKPDLFKENQGVVIQGKLSTRGLESEKLFVKHSEEYRKPDDHKSMDAEYLKKSMFKNEKP